ncbi:hypothetical protein M426DRAFT_324268 [Hypoxylon sp. CI-4A]|nr:hypothetical protein M426DRAFT_324268 [Hypoxylon sp. CI-4A]
MTPDQVRDVFENVPEGEEVKALEQVLETAKQLQSENSPQFENLTEAVGNGSREERWRLPLGESGLLDFFLHLIGDNEPSSDVAKHVLRIIGNSSADQDENRQRVVDSGCFPQLVKLLGHPVLLQLAIPVLYNICVDYEPAQSAAAKANLSTHLFTLLTEPELYDKAKTYISIVYKLFGIAASQESEPGPTSEGSRVSYLLLSRLTSQFKTASLELEDFLGASTAALAYLSHEQLQNKFLWNPDAIKVFLEAFQIAARGSLVFTVDDAEEQTQLETLQSTYTQTLADLSANSAFVDLCPLDSPPVQLLLQWVYSPTVPLQTAACLTLGNLARSDASSVTLVQEKAIHKSLIAILSADVQDIDLQLLHSALSFMKNLSIPASNKSVLGDAGLLDLNMLPRIWNLDTQPQIQFDAISLARLLLVNCPANVRRVCIKDTETPSPLEQLMELHRKADQEPIKMETGRAVANICRALHSEKPLGSILVPESSTPSSDEEASSLLQDFYQKHPALADTLLYLGLQSKFPVLKSELWFVLALMARSAEGSGIITQWTKQRPEIVNVLVEAITGEKAPENQRVQDVTDNPAEASGLDLSALGGSIGQLEPQQVDPAKAATMTKVDRENGLVLISELLRRSSDKLDPSVRNTFGQILKTGGELVLGERNTS